jgi:MraZ protein
MIDLHGEFECRIDEKSRIILPMGLLKQIPKKSQDKFMIKRGFEGCLNIFPWTEWEAESKKVSKVDLFREMDRNFMRNFMSGSADVALDGSNRILIPKTLLVYAHIDKDVVLTAFANIIEVWAKEEYEKQVNLPKADFAKLTEKVMCDPPKTQD